MPLFTDTYTPPEVTDTTREHATVLVSNLENGRHTLELRAEEGPVSALNALRVFRPPFEAPED